MLAVTLKGRPSIRRRVGGSRGHRRRPIGRRGATTYPGGVPELLLSAGKLVRDDDGKPITVRRYSDNLLLALLKTRRPPRRERSVRFVLPALHSAPDAPNALAAIAAAVGTGEITPAEAGELSRVVETYVKALQAQNTLPKAFDDPDTVDARERNLELLEQVASRHRAAGNRVWISEETD